jgi:transcription elongation factor Elf1
MEIEHFFICPYCGEDISFVLDLSAGPQAYTEDCEVCCRPIQIDYVPEGGQLREFAAETIDE